mmetsp:Transcript_11827/g.16379  ORF Transcript_11827/g.16379 Transcript_11827/m.16379 type:complete len:89 (-) Transcript_11827:92-358(-)
MMLMTNFGLVQQRNATVQSMAADLVFFGAASTRASGASEAAERSIVREYFGESVYRESGEAVVLSRFIRTHMLHRISRNCEHYEDWGC